jgi:hypothetical protein
MRITRGDTVAGIPVKALRDRLRRSESLSIGTFENLIDDGRSAEQVVADLIAAGYLEHERGDWYRASAAGRRLRNAKFLKPIPREKANLLFEGFMDRVAEVNRREELTHVVEEVRVFGSFLGDSPDLGDLDLAARLVRRAEDFEEFLRMNEARVEASRRTTSRTMSGSTSASGKSSASSRTAAPTSRSTAWMTWSASGRPTSSCSRPRSASQSR